MKYVLHWSDMQEPDGYRVEVWPSREAAEKAYEHGPRWARSYAKHGGYLMYDDADPRDTSARKRHGARAALPAHLPEVTP